MPDRRQYAAMEKVMSLCNSKLCITITVVSC